MSSAIVTGDWYLESLVKFAESNAEALIEGTLVLKLNPTGLQYVTSRLDALAELESLLAGAPIDYFRAYVSDLGDHRALEQLRRILRRIPSLKVFSVLPPPARDPSPLSLVPFARVRVLELRGCDLSTSAARGLVELRLSLEKLICHNSTDALRHVFASRMVDIKDSSQWNRLSFVSCACNGLLLMDESLQLLPAVETLDLSRNKFARVDNLRKCTKLKHLDLGFNHLRSVSSFSEVSSRVVKLVLRNNALTTLRGIDNLRSLEGLDLSNNIIANFMEIDIIGGLSSLQNLWLEGNPICYATWYRAQVLSFFPHPEKLKLDGKTHTKSDLWKRQIIIARMHKRPASFGFYSPARDDAELDGIIISKRKKIPRFASINNEEESMLLCSDEDSASFINVVHSRAKNAFSDQESGIIDFMNRIEFMKKERDGVWLQEFKEWMDCENCITGVNGKTTNLRLERGKQRKGKTRDKQNGDKKVEDSDAFFTVSETDSKVFVDHIDGSYECGTSTRNNQENARSLTHEVLLSLNNTGKLMSSISTTLDAHSSVAMLDAHSSVASSGSPPHYKEDILHQRHNLEEFMQLSPESFSIASSDTNTSSSTDDSIQYEPFTPPDINQLLAENL